MKKKARKILDLKVANHLKIASPVMKTYEEVLPHLGNSPQEASQFFKNSNITMSTKDYTKLVKNFVGREHLGSGWVKVLTEINTHEINAVIDDILGNPASLLDTPNPSRGVLSLVHAFPFLLKGKPHKFINLVIGVMNLSPKDAVHFLTMITQFAEKELSINWLKAFTFLEEKDYYHIGFKQEVITLLNSFNWNYFPTQDVESLVEVYGYMGELSGILMNIFPDNYTQEELDHLHYN